MCKKIAITTGLLLVSTLFYGQDGIAKKSNFGFSFGVNYSSIEHNLSDVIRQSDRFGMRLGILGEFKLVKGLYFSPKAELSFNRGSVEYEVPNVFQRDYVLVPAGLEGKANFTYKFREGKKINPYAITGVSYIHSLEKELQTFEYGSQSYYAIDIGIGVERQFDHFIFAPEFRYSRGLTDVNQNPQFNGDILLHNFAFVLVFKG
tara:strand:- start:419 stop:1030 length:612 start_codon:yes stop_codon:yes gene_type:complete